MLIKNILKIIIPEPIKKILRPIRNFFVNKHNAELSFWKNRFKVNKGRFNNAHYERLMLAMAEENSQAFIKGKIIADFGCGPNGSLVWAKLANLRIGIDVLADKYADEFKDTIISHGMIYLKSTEKVIPLQSDFVDIIFTVNAIDHVDNFHDMCNEIIRVLKPGGKFIGSFNLEEPSTPYEPQRLDEELIRENLLSNLEVHSYRIAKKGPVGNRYKYLYEGNFPYNRGEEGILWVVAKKPIY